jgi:hypothetical protein
VGHISGWLVAWREVPAALLAATVILCGLLAPQNALASVTLTLDPGQGPADSSISITPAVPNTVNPDVQNCSLYWDQQFIQTFSCGVDANGVPASTTMLARNPPGQHTILVCEPACFGAERPKWQGTAQFLTRAVVPNLMGHQLAGVGGVQDALQGASLNLGQVKGSSDPAATVITQNPGVGTVVDPGSTVDITLATPITRVTVPDLHSLTEAAAASLIDTDQLQLGTVTGTGRVTAQNPLAGTSVAAGTSVNLTLAVAPPPLVAVPDVRGLTVEAATRSARTSGLTLEASGPSARTVRSQRPDPGTLVPVGSVITVTVGSSTISRPTAFALAAIVLTLLGVLIWVARKLRLRGPKRTRRWVAEHVDVRTRVDPALVTTAGHSERPPSPTVDVAVRTRTAAAEITIEELPR